ncbi:DNA polymerase III subunit beta [Clostridiaceae bacterium M8S5]|nr:DNA polymerase III subunit beta [Clostridiaceae bacterium M8S5]
MNFKIPQKLLNKSISTVQKGVSNRSTLPILTGILIEAKNNKLKLTGTDLELGIVTTIDCEVIEEGSFVIDSKLFGEIIRKLPDLPIEIHIDDNNYAHIKCDNSNFKIKVQLSQEYPKLPSIDDTKCITISKETLKSMIRQTAFATATEDFRPVLTGELLEISGNEISLVAIDQYRMAYRKLPMDGENDIKIVIPGKTLVEINKIIEGVEEDIKISISTNHILFHLGNTIVTSILIEGEFINYKDIVRNEYNSKVIVKTKDVQESIERASLLAKEGNNNLIKFEIVDDKMIISSNSEMGFVQEEVPINLDGDDLTIAFNSKYILDGLKVIDSEEIEMHFINNVNPCIIKPISNEDYIYLVLPVRIPNEL